MIPENENFRELGSIKNTVATLEPNNIIPVIKSSLDEFHIRKKRLRR